MWVFSDTACGRASDTLCLVTLGVSTVGIVFQCGALHNRLRLTLKDREKLQEELSMAKALVIQVKVCS